MDKLKLMLGTCVLDFIIVLSIAMWIFQGNFFQAAYSDAFSFLFGIMPFMITFNIGLTSLWEG